MTYFFISSDFQKVNAYFVLGEETLQENNLGFYFGCRILV